MLVLEDLQWATPPTLLLLRHLVQHLGDARLLILGTYRDEEVTNNPTLRDLIAEIHASGSASKLELHALDADDVSEMVTTLVPSAPAENVSVLAQRVRDESAGNAFFVCEVLDHLAGNGQLERLVTDGQIGERLPIPDSVRDVVGQRLGRLSPDAEDLLTTAAVIGLAFDLTLLAEVVGRPTEQVLEQIEHFERAALVNEIDAGRYSFSHAIVRMTLLERLSATRQALAHRRVAEAIEVVGGGRDDELSHHWHLAGEEAKSFAYLESAAARDYAALAYESAAERYQQVIDFAERAGGDPAMEARSWLGLGLATRALGQADYFLAVEHAGRLARKLRDADLMADAATCSIHTSSFFNIAGRTETGLVELCEDALALVDVGGSPPGAHPVDPRGPAHLRPGPGAPAGPARTGTEAGRRHRRSGVAGRSAVRRVHRPVGSEHPRPADSSWPGRSRGSRGRPATSISSSSAGTSSRSAWPRRRTSRAPASACSASSARSRCRGTSTTASWWSG